MMFGHNSFMLAILLLLIQVAVNCEGYVCEFDPFFRIEIIPHPPVAYMGEFQIFLDDVVQPECAALSIRKGDSVIDKRVICAGQSSTWVSPTGEKYRIFVVEVAGGYTYAEKWADVRVY